MDDENLPSWATIRKAVAKLAEDRGEWAGIPVPLQDMQLVLEPRYPYAALADTEEAAASANVSRICAIADAISGTKVVNSWFNGRTKIVVVHQNGRAKVVKIPMYGGSSIDLLINTIGAARAWDFEAELRAVVRLRQLVSKWAFECYMMVGMFLESSTRSNMIYLFRRCRPTIALTKSGEDSLKILASLCMHPIGYYLNSFAGVMVPTDDVLSHLMLMRADERRFWSKCNHHALWEPEAGC